MKRLYTLLFLLFILAACSKQEEEPNPVNSEAGKISLESNSVTGYELAVIQVEGYALTESDYDIEVGSRKIKAAKNTESSLVFLVPGDLTTGIHELRVGFAENALDLTVTAPEPISDPVAYVTEFKGDLNQEIEDYKVLTGSATAPAQMINAKQELEQAMEEFKALHVSEQLATAQIIKANEAFFLEANRLIANFKSSSSLLEKRTIGLQGVADDGNWDDCKTMFCITGRTIATVAAAAMLVKLGALGAVVGTVAGVVGAGVLGFDAAMSFITGKKSFTFSYLSRIALVALDLAYWAPTFTAKVTLDRADKELTSGFDMRIAAGELKILKGEAFTITPKVTFRTFSAEDVNSKSPLVKDAITKWEKAKAYYNQTLKSPFGPLPDYISKSRTVVPKSMEEWEIKVLNNSLVTVTEPAGTAEQFTVLFNSTSKVEQNFDFSITYKNEVEETTQSFSAILVPQRNPNVVSIVSGNNQTAEANVKLANPLKLKVVDVNGKELEGVAVEWSVKAGGGSLSSSTSKTDATGVAQVEWTLGSTGDQEVEAMVKKSDGSLVNGAPQIFKAAIGSKISTVAGGNGQGIASNQLHIPYGVYLDSEGNVYVADVFNHRVQKWAPGASSGVTVAGGNGRGSAANQLDYPRGVHVDGAGNVYVADYTNHRVQKWAPGASSGVTVAGGNGAGGAANQLYNPQDVYLDNAGNVYVASASNVRKWAPGASSGVYVAGDKTNSIYDIHVDDLGNVYVADKGNRVQKWAPGASSGVTVAGGNGKGSAANQLEIPEAVYVDAAGNVYVADSRNHRIQKWAPGASAGETVAGGNGYGPRDNQLAWPRGVHVDSNGNIYITDSDNARVQRWAQ